MQQIKIKAFFGDWHEADFQNCAYERAEKEFDDWFNDTRTKKALETLSE